MMTMTAVAKAADFECDIYRQEPAPALMNLRSVGIVTGSPVGIYSKLGQNLATLMDDRCSKSTPFRLVVMQGIGSRGNLDDIKNLRRVDIGLVQSDVLESLHGEEARRAHEDMRYIAPLHQEIIHILANRDIKSYRDLDGKLVNIDLIGSGTQVTARNMFARLNINPKFDSDATAQALGRLAAGEVQALVFVSGRGAPGFTGVQDPQVIARGLHFIALPHSLAQYFEPTYQRAKLTHDDYNALFRPGEEVETWAMRAIMAAYAWDRDPARYQDRYTAVKLFIDEFFKLAPRLGEPRFRGFWCEVDLRDSVPGWRRFDAAEQWLTANPTAQTKPCGITTTAMPVPVPIPAPVPVPNPTPQPANPASGCEAKYIDEVHRLNGITPNLANPYWRGEYNTWKRANGCT